MSGFPQGRLFADGVSKLAPFGGSTVWLVAGLASLLAMGHSRRRGRPTKTRKPYDLPFRSGNRSEDPPGDAAPSVTAYLTIEATNPMRCATEARIT